MSEQAHLDAVLDQLKALTRAVNDSRNERMEDRRLLAEAVGVISRFDDRLRDITSKIAKLDVRPGEENSELKSIMTMEIGGRIASLATRIDIDLHEIDQRLSKFESGQGPTLGMG